MINEPYYITTMLI